LRKHSTINNATKREVANTSNVLLNDPLEVLKLRYASGEITRDELQEKIETINAISKNAELF